MTTGTGTLNYIYDACGNLTNDGVHTYTYDSENRLVSVDAGASAQYAYDHQGRRCKKMIGSTTTHYIWEGVNVLAEHNGSSGTNIADYVYGFGGIVAKITGGATQYFLGDRSSIRMTLDASGNVVGRQGHLPFGEDFAESGSQEKHHFTTYERDTESGGDYALGREFASITGRFTQTDPSSAVGTNPLVMGGFGDPQSLNKYNYSRNDAVNVRDTTGANYCIGYDAYSIWYAPEKIIIVYLGFIPSFCFANGGTGRANPIPPGPNGGNPVYKPVKKHYENSFPCNKSATDATANVVQNFPSLANGFYNFDLAFQENVHFSGTVAVGNTLNIEIHLYGPMIPPSGFTSTMSVKVTDIGPNSFTYKTDPGHPLDPGTITFSITDAGNGQVKFAIDVDANADGLINSAMFALLGGAGEDALWNGLIDNVKKKVCGN